MNRRHFLASSVTALSASRVFGANERLRIGFIGLGGRAGWLLKNEKFAGADIVAIADCYLPNLDRATTLRPEGRRWPKYSDYRRMFEKEKLDAVFVETTTHARVLIAIHALEAGLDVYGEKPLTLTVEEGRILANAVQRYKRVLQTGTQQRSIPINAWASKFIREGGLGKIHTVQACNFQPPRRWTPQPEEPIPEGLNWDQWCNQRELRPYCKLLRTKWANYWDYDGGGQSWGVSGWGTHALDQIQCALGTDDTGPVEYTPEGPGQTAPVVMRYASGTLLKCTAPERPDHSDLGGIFFGEKGKLEIKRGTLVADPISLIQGAPPDFPEGPGENSFHIANFFDCIRTRKTPNASVEIGHRSTTVCHLMNICRDVQRRVRWDPVQEQIIDDAEASAMLSRPRRKGFELPKV